MTIEELFGTLQQATVASWRKHLRTAKYAKHEALDEFYKELPEKVDALIEGYMGAHGKKITKFENIIKSSNMNTLKYLQELKKICKQGYGLLDENEELKGLLDDIVNLINSTLYKVKELAESSVIDLKDYLMESLVEESCEYDYDAKRFNPKDCLTWLIKTKLLDKYSDSKYDAEEWAELAQAAAEEAGLPLDAAERVYDAAYYLNEALTNEAKGLTTSLKKDIDSYLRGMNNSDLKALRDGWKEGDGNAAYDKMMHEMDMYLFAGIPGKFDPYKKIISSYIYGKILDRVGVN